MSDFSFWVILSNLLNATQWTIILSLIAFVSGGVVGLVREEVVAEIRCAHEDHVADRVGAGDGKSAASPAREEETIRPGRDGRALATCEEEPERSRQRDDVDDLP
mgnify:CR=1 FL=1